MAIVVSLLVVVAVIAGGIFYRRRQNGPGPGPDRDPEIPLEGPINPNTGGGGSGAFGKLRVQYPCHAVFKEARKGF